MTEVSSLTTMQAELTARWDKACSYMDSGEPYTERFWTSMANFWAMMERFDAMESSLRRAGFKGCIHKSTESTRSETSGCKPHAVSCYACVGRTSGKKQGYNDMVRMAT